MDFISADRSRDSEFQAGLKDYNFGVEETNKQITKDIQNDRDTEKQTERDIDNTELFTQLKDAGGQATGLASATATFQNFQKYAGQIQEQVENAKKVAGDTAQKIQQIKATTETPPDQLGGKVGSAVEEGGALSDVSKGLKVEEAVSKTTEALKTGANVGSAIGKAGSVALKGVGVVGALAGGAMAIASDAHGGFAKMSLADKIGNVAEIGGAGLDIVGTALEATGVGIPLGLALQGLGTIAQIGAGIESEISSKESVDPAKKEAQQEEQQQEASEQKPVQEETAVSESQAGGLAVARQQQ